MGKYYKYVLLCVLKVGKNSLFIGENFGSKNKNINSLLMTLIDYAIQLINDELQNTTALIPKMETLRWLCVLID